MTTENTLHQTDKMSVSDAIGLAIDRIDEATAKFKPVWMSAGLSGGNDSVAATYVASLAKDFRSAFHIDTGVGLKITEDYVRNVCALHGWPLECYKAMENTRADGAPDPQDYFKLVEERGFPGPAMHFKMYQRLKQRQIERWCRAHKKWRSREVLMLVSGRRAQESHRRMGKVVGPYERVGRVIWANPLHDFSKVDCARIMEYGRIVENPFYKMIHKSGECLCGAFAAPGELAETTAWFKDDPTVLRLNAMDARMRDERGWGWGGRPPGTGCKVKASGPMCGKCDLAHEAQEMATEQVAASTP